MKKQALKLIGIWIMFFSSVALMYFTHLVVLNIKSYETLGVHASGDVNLTPVIYSLSVVAIGYAIYKVGAKLGNKISHKSRSRLQNSSSI
jgi:hypothetical protein